jgi:serine/threonine-protein kinase
MTPKPSTPVDTARDELLAQLLAQLSEEARQGRQPDPSAVAARHPDVAAELRQLWAAVQLADAFACPAAQLTQAPSSASPILPIETLPRAFGDYELLDVIGKGGMGVVYKARQRSLRRIVALKMMVRGERDRFAIEAQAAAHLDHPNLVAVHEAGEWDGQAYFSMRYVEGRTLSALLAEGPLHARDAARILATVSRAVHYAHERGILHRDLKPSNILLDRAGQPHVTDFGLAKRVTTPDGLPAVSGLTLSGAIVGTPAYMAPEQVSGSRGKPSPVSDVYSLGVILYEMLTGRPPFQAPTPVDTLLLVLDQEPIRPRLLNPNVDPDLELICLKCLQKEPELRYASAAGLAADLEAHLQGESPSVRSFGLRDMAELVRLMFRETHNAVVLENWGVLWMCHSGMILLQCVLTTWLACRGVSNPLWYLLLWGGGLCAWGPIFWSLRKRGGPVLFIERQVAHVWAASVASTIGVFILEMTLGQPVLSLSPMLAVIAGMVFVVKAGMFSGSFYLSAAAMFLTAIPTALPPIYPNYSPLLFGVVVALMFFLPGWKYYRQRQRGLHTDPALTASPTSSRT